MVHKNNEKELLNKKDIKKSKFNIKKHLKIFFIIFIVLIIFNISYSIQIKLLNDQCKDKNFDIYHNRECIKETNIYDSKTGSYKLCRMKYYDTNNAEDVCNKSITESIPK